MTSLLVLVAAAIACLAAPAALAQTTRPAEARPVAAPVAAPGPLVTTGSGYSYSRHGTIITTGSGRTVSIGARRGSSTNLPPASASPTRAAAGK